MAMTWSNASNKATCDARAARLAGGFVDVYTAGFAVLLARIGLGSPAFGAATTATPSIATVNPTTRDESANATGAAAAFHYVASDGTTVEGSGTVTATGGGGDLTMASTTITAGQPVEIGSLQLRQA